MNSAVPFEEEKVFHLEFHSEGEKLRVGQFESSIQGQKTLRYYEDSIISFNRTKEYSKRVAELLSGANREGRVGKENLISLKQAGQIFYEELFPPGIRKRLDSTGLKTLVLSVDDRLVHIPWELIYDGQEFLCLRFNMGRLVSTNQNTIAQERKICWPLKMLLIIDPRGNLPYSYNEGIRLRDMLDERDEAIKVDLKSTNVNMDYIRSKLRLFDIFHYAGHAEYNIQTPGESGFLLNNGKLTAKVIKEMVGRMPFPSFVFSNACQSGQTEAWKAAEGCEGVYGLANAFLLSGVRHYLGTFWEIQDESGLYYSLRFYEELMKGTMIGEAVRKARLGLLERYGEDTIVWASYMLYGDPSFKYVSSPHCSEERKPHVREKIISLTGPTRTSHEGSLKEEKGKKEKKEKKLKRKKAWCVLAGSLVVLCVVLLVFLTIEKWVDEKSDYDNIGWEKVEKTILDPGDKRAENINKRLKELAEKYIKGDISKIKGDDEWTSFPLSLAFLDVKGPGISNTQKDYIQGKVIQALKNTGRVTIVEREILNRLLDELDLSQSDLTDQSIVLRLGKVFSARLISTGSIAREKKNWLVGLRFIETETTAVKSAISICIETRDENVVSKKIATQFIKDLKNEYPFQGEIVSMDKEGIIINLGSEVGMSEGIVMDVLSSDNRIVGRIETIAVTDTSRTLAKVLSQENKITKNLRVKEIVRGAEYTIEKKN